jgi:hypothetical protein
MEIHKRKEEFMQIASVVLARIYALFPIEDLNPTGAVYYPDVVAWLVQKFGFQKYPTKLEDFDENKGIEFIGGKSNRVTIEKLVILNNGVYVDTMASTDESEMVLNETLEAAARELGIFYHDKMIKRRAYVSSLAFYSDEPMFMIDPIFTEIAQIVTREVHDHFGKPLPYEPTVLSLQYDATTTKLGPAPFSIQRREGSPFEDKKYFSTAPVRTNVHLELLGKIEKAASRAPSPR